MTVADLLCILASEIQDGRSKWEVDVSILKKTPSAYDNLRHFGEAVTTQLNFNDKTLLIMSKERPIKGCEL